MHRQICRSVLTGFGLCLVLFLCVPNVDAGETPVFPFQGVQNTPEALNQGLKEIDLAFQPLPGRVYNEQKFLLCQSESGHMLMIGMYIVRFGPIKKYGISLTVILPDLKRIFIKHIYDEETFRFSTRECLVEAGNDFFKGSYPDYTLHIQDPKVTLTLSIHDLVPGWRPGNGRVYFGEEKEKYYDFVMSNARARATGELRLKGKAKGIPIKGMLYSDHCYVNLMPTDQAVNWYSLRAFGKDLSVNYIEFVTPEAYGSRRVPWLLVADNESIRYATLNVQQKLSGYRKDSKSGYEYPTLMELAVSDPGFRLNARVESMEIIDRFDVFSDLNPALRFLAKAFFHRPIIFRFMSRYAISMEQDPGTGTPGFQQDLKGKGMSEVLFVQ